MMVAHCWVIMEKTNSGDRSDYDDDAETASRATGESIKCGEVSFLVISSISFV